MTRKTNDRLNVAKVMKDFQKEEAVSSRRKGTFKIAKPFDEALDAILRVGTAKHGSKHNTR